MVLGEKTAKKWYKATEDTAVKGYQAVEDKFVKTFFAKEGETVEENSGLCCPETGSTTIRALGLDGSFTR